LGRAAVIARLRRRKLSETIVLVYVSGIHGGPKPSPGIGVARSLKAAFPTCRTIGVDYSNASPGIHLELFDDILLQRAWGQIDLDTFQAQVRRLLGPDAAWIPGLDHEAALLSTISHPRVLAPPPPALQQTAQPEIDAHRMLPLRAPDALPLMASDQELYAFCRLNDWQIWLRGAPGGARKVRSWPEFALHRDELAHACGSEGLFLQAHVAGYEESLAFCAYHGALLDCVAMRRRAVTPAGTTWSGNVAEAPPALRAALAQAAAELGWTGGGEIVSVQDRDGERWAIDWRPVFPAWIYGATLAGRNLPAALAAAAFGVPAAQAAQVSTEFTRVVVEIPVRRAYPLPPLAELGRGDFGGPRAGQPAVPAWPSTTRAALVAEGSQAQGMAPAVVRLAVPADDALHTPARISLEKDTGRLYAEVMRQAAQVAEQSGIAFSVAYSIKTDPSVALIRLARDAGILAEAISQSEVLHAVRCGYRPGEIVLNGPAKFWPVTDRSLLPSLRAVFCDSLSELRSLARALPAEGLIGVRLRPPAVASRFGIPVATLHDYRRLIWVLREEVPQHRIGVHFHMASSSVGIDGWWGLFESVRAWAEAIQADAGKAVEILDLGGGWDPDDLQPHFLSRLSGALRGARAGLPRLTEVIIEPGKALSQASALLLVRVLDVRRGADGASDVAVDGAIADMPEIFSYPHRVLARHPSGLWFELQRGRDRILGRTCMEMDMLATGVAIPDFVAQGALLAFTDAGAYNRSMAYAFGQGE